MRISLRCLATRSLVFLPVLFAVCLATASPQSIPIGPKPQVRAITAFMNIDRARYQMDIAETVKFLRTAQQAFRGHGYTVQTLRIVTQPFAEYTKGLSREEALRFFKNLDGIAEQEHVLVSIGPAYISGDDGEAQADLLADVLRSTRFLNGTVSVTTGDSVDWSAVKAAARVIKILSEETPSSEGNFRFAAIAEMPAYSPFFPAAYHTGAGRQFTVGLESANTVIVAFQAAPGDPVSARRRLSELFFHQMFDIEDVARTIDRDQSWTYLGLDLSPAPGKEASIGAAIESLSGQPFGAPGTLTAVGTLTAALKDIGARKVGYSGVMLPIFEDPRLALRWESGLVSLDSLMSYSAVCGTGLDGVPLPGDTSVETLARIIGDVATLAVKWNKPLSARLLPIAGKHAGDRTEFTDSRLVNLTLQPIASGAH